MNYIVKIKKKWKIKLNNLYLIIILIKNNKFMKLF